jgi:hypothetical protein
MSDSKTRARVRRLRQSRRERGLTETNVWLPQEVRAAIDRAVETGSFPSRRMAIIHALTKEFANTEQT